MSFAMQVARRAGRASSASGAASSALFLIFASLCGGLVLRNALKVNGAVPLDEDDQGAAKAWRNNS